MFNLIPCVDVGDSYSQLDVSIPGVAEASMIVDFPSATDEPTAADASARVSSVQGSMRADALGPAWVWR